MRALRTKTKHVFLANDPLEVYQNKSTQQFLSTLITEQGPTQVFGVVRYPEQLEAAITTGPDNTPHT